MIVKVKNPTAVDYMVPYLKEDNESGVDVPEILKKMIVNNPEGILVVQAWEGEELKAFIVAFAPETSSHSFIQDVWAAEGVDLSIVDRLFFKVVVWTEGIGKLCVKIESNEGPSKHIIDKWLFRIDTVVHRFDISAFEEMLVKSRVEEEPKVESKVEPKSVADLGDEEKDEEEDEMDKEVEKHETQSLQSKLSVQTSPGLPRSKGEVLSRTIADHERRVERS